MPRLTLGLLACALAARDAFASFLSAGSSLPVVGTLLADASGKVNVVQADRARLAALSAQGSLPAKRDTPVAITNNGVTYLASVGVGSPATYYNLLVDTGSSNTWLNASKAYVTTPTSRSTQKTVSVKYGSGSFHGIEYIDQVALADGLVVHNQSIGVASSATGFADGIDGILGLGPTDLTLSTLQDANETVPTVLDNLRGQGALPSDAFGVSFAPVGDGSSARNGQIDFGGADPTKFAGELTYAPIAADANAGRYWGIEQSVSYAGKRILGGAAGIVDTGTTLVYLATDAYEAYKNATGAVRDEDTELLRIDPSAYGKLQNLDFAIGGQTFTLVPNAQIWPRKLNGLIGGKNDSLYLIVNDIGSVADFGFINGYAFHERFYSVYDAGARRVGFAPTPWTNATVN